LPEFKADGGFELEEYMEYFEDSNSPPNAEIGGKMAFPDGHELSKEGKMPPFKSQRSVKRYVMRLSAAPADVFPLLCPVREYDWIEPWSCEMVYTAGGVAEANAVFKTNFPAQGGEETWVVCRYEKDRAIEFIRVIPNFKVNRLDIALSSDNGATVATWTHTYTGLSEAGNQWIRGQTDEVFRSEKVALEKMLNYYLETGTRLSMAELELESDPYGPPSTH
jgi:hypothetical protein